MDNRSISPAFLEQLERVMPNLTFLQGEIMARCLSKLRDEVDAMGYDRKARFGTVIPHERINELWVEAEAEVEAEVEAKAKAKAKAKSARAVS